MKIALATISALIFTIIGISSAEIFETKDGSIICNCPKGCTKEDVEDALQFHDGQPHIQFYAQGCRISASSETFIHCKCMPKSNFGDTDDNNSAKPIVVDAAHDKADEDNDDDGVDDDDRKHDLEVLNYKPRPEWPMGRLAGHFRHRRHVEHSFVTDRS